MPEPPSSGSRYAEIGAFQGAEHYDRNAFTRGTEQETEALVRLLALRPGERLLDVGCGTGRHVRALGARGMRAVGVDASHALLLGAPSGRVATGDARLLPLRDGVMDAVISLCQGGFGLTPASDRRALTEMTRVLRPGGRLALTAFSLVFAARYLGSEDALDVERGLHHQLAEVRGPDGAAATFDLWTAAYSPAHLRQLVADAGLQIEAIYGAEPGRYGSAPVLLSDPELMVIARKPEPG